LASAPTRTPPAATPAQQAEYWERVVAGWPSGARAQLWRQHSDRVNGALLARWLPPAPVPRALKTDVFEEAVGEGLLPLLAARARAVFGVDVSRAAVGRAAERHRRLRGVVGDVRRLPFRSGSFDLVVSTSTLDHFERASDIEDALAEIARVLRAGGELVITMDNVENPVLAVRARLQAPLLRLGVLPYRTGVSCGAAGLRRLLAGAGFTVRDETTVLHAPRAPAVAAARVLDACGATLLGRGYLRLLGAFERLAATRLAPVSGYFVAARAVKR
jgi:SAM-dependent methyltransferase